MLMKAGTSENRSITPEKAKKILLEKGVEVTEKEAKELLDLMYFFAKLSVEQYIKEVSNYK